MPPRYAYWTILIDNAPTAFRAREQAELLPTFNQLRRTNPNVLFKWFARGRLWDTPEQAQWAARHTEAFRERRGRDWRPGGQHHDPRQRGTSERSRTQAPAQARAPEQAAAPKNLRAPERPRTPKRPQAPRHAAPRAHAHPRAPKKR